VKGEASRSGGVGRSGTTNCRDLRDTRLVRLRTATSGQIGRPPLADGYQTRSAGGRYALTQ